MSTSTATAPTPRAPRETLRTTLDDFRKDCVGWQRDVGVLFDDIDSFLSRDVPVRPVAHASPRDHSEISGLRNMIEQQTEILTALVSALAEQPSSSVAVAEPASPPPQPARRRERAARRRYEPDDESTGMLLRQFQELERLSHDEGR